MATKYAQHFSTKQTPQSESIPGKPMVENSSGGFSFQVDCWKRLERFLILGCEKGSYYASERKLTAENAKCVLECAERDINRTVDTIARISIEGRAPKNDPAVFALGLISGKREALSALSSVCRTGTHLFSFIEAAQGNRGWGRSLKRAIQRWYLDKTPRDLAYSLVKYQSRNGFSNRDALRLCKPKGAEGLHNLAIRWAVGKVTEEDLSQLGPIYAFEQAKRATTKKEIVRLISEYDLVRECIPTQFLNEPEVWEALLDKMPLNALVRNLGKMTAVGLIKPLSSAVATVTAKLSDTVAMKKARVHPIALLLAQSVYSQGHGDKGSLSWSAVPQVVDALDKGFYAAFAAVEPTNKRWLLALDVSGSMGMSCIAGTSIDCRKASAAMALVTAAVEPQHAFVAFTSGGWKHGTGQGRWSLSHGIHNGISQVAISARQRLSDVCNQIGKLQMGGTDCALPMLYALDQKIPVDVFCVLTDSETWAGNIHPTQALNEYRQKMGIPAKLVVVGMVANDFTIADPSDSGTLDVVGFDTAVPQVLADFAKS